MDLIHRRAPDYWLVLPVIALAGVGVVMVYSASAIVAADRFGDPAFFLKRQVLWVLLGGAALAVTHRIHYAALRRFTPLLLVLAGLSLVAVLVPGIGRVAGGARRWIAVGGPFAFQPSESAKLALAFYLANFLANRGQAVRDLRSGVLPPLVVTGVMGGLVLLQPDLGTALLMVLLALGMLFAAGARIGHLLMVVTAGLPLLATAILGEEYRRRRILAFLDPWADPQGAGFHIIQSLLALGSGGLLGVGLGGSRQKFFYLPERHTDFVFAILGEELGLLGTGAVVLLFALLAFRGYRVARRAPDRYGSLLAAGITTMILVQAVINVGVTAGVFPVTGVPLPFVSFGGSSMLFTMIGVGVLLNISQYARDAAPAAHRPPSVASALAAARPTSPR
ncbi:MAG TPA: putative lipid II flippase FtsW [bacterium]|nr:putative lipid II flippase FtsW [bacterium]